MDISEAARALGKVKSPRKAASSAENLAKARAARWKATQETQSPAPPDPQRQPDLTFDQK